MTRHKKKRKLNKNKNKNNNNNKDIKVKELIKHIPFDELIVPSPPSIVILCVSACSAIYRSLRAPISSFQSFERFRKIIIHEVIFHSKSFLFCELSEIAYGMKYKFIAWLTIIPSIIISIVIITAIIFDCFILLREQTFFANRNSKIYKIKVREKNVRKINETIRNLYLNK